MLRTRVPTDTPVYYWNPLCFCKLLVVLRYHQAQFLSLHKVFHYQQALFTVGVLSYGNSATATSLFENSVSVGFDPLSRFVEIIPSYSFSTMPRYDAANLQWMEAFCRVLWNEPTKPSFAETRTRIDNQNQNRSFDWWVFATNRITFIYNCTIIYSRVYLNDS